MKLNQQKVKRAVGAFSASPFPDAAVGHLFTDSRRRPLAVSARPGRPPSPPLYTQQWEQELWDDCPLGSEAQRTT